MEKLENNQNKLLSVEEAFEISKINKLKIKEKKDQDWFEESSAKFESLKPKLEKAILEAIENGETSLNLDKASGQCLHGYYNIIAEYYADFGYYAFVKTTWEYDEYINTQLHWDIDFIKTKFKEMRHHCEVFKDNPYVGESLFKLKILRKIVAKFNFEEEKLSQNKVTVKVIDSINHKSWRLRFKEWLAKYLP